MLSLMLMAGLGNASSNTTNDTTVQTTQTQAQTQKKKTEKTKKKSDDKAKEVTKTESDLISPTDLVVRFVDVGQGDATIIEFPDGKTMLIDTPTGKSSVVKAALRADGRSTIDWLVATHPDADHIGGLDTIISSMDIGSIWAPEVNGSTQTYTRLLTSISNKGMGIEPAYAGRQIATGENYAIDILWPQQGASYSEDNAYSVVIKVTYGQGLAPWQRLGHEQLACLQADAHDRRAFVWQEFLRASNSGRS